MSESTEFAARYSPWAIIAGASEGVGRAFARKIAARGVHCILIARRMEPLEQLAETIRRESGVECVGASIDLSEPGAFDRLLGVVGAREIGLFVGNAGADPHATHFLEQKVETWIDLVERNVVFTMRACHHFGGAMRERRRGGLLLVGSGAASSGAAGLATYSGSKAFGVRFAESLWAELSPDGVDVLCLILSVTDTPALHQLMAEKGRAAPSRMASPEQVAEVGLERLSRGPVYDWLPMAGLRARWIRTRVKLISALSKRVIGGD